MLWVISVKKDYKNIMLITLFVLILGVGTNVYAANVGCTGVFEPELLNTLKNTIYIPIKWAAPILLVLLTSFDFAKVVFSGKKEDMDKIKNNFLKRAVAAFIIFVAPDIIILIVDVVGGNNAVSIKSCLGSLK